MAGDKTVERVAQRVDTYLADTRCPLIVAIDTPARVGEAQEFTGSPRLLGVETEMLPHGWLEDEVDDVTGAEPSVEHA